jgi:hypothetical protein
LPSAEGKFGGFYKHNANDADAKVKNANTIMHDGVYANDLANT